MHQASCRSSHKPATLSPFVTSQPHASTGSLSSISNRASTYLRARLLEETKAVFESVGTLPAPEGVRVRVVARHCGDRSPHAVGLVRRGARRRDRDVPQARRRGRFS